MPAYKACTASLHSFSSRWHLIGDTFSDSRFSCMRLEALIGSAAAGALSISMGPVGAVPQEVHERCKGAADYAGCVGVLRSDSAEEQVRTGIMWDTAKWKNNNNTVRIKTYRMRGGGLWLGNSMRLSVMEVHCDKAEFDVQSDGYKQQSLEGDAYRQAPLIFAKLCTQPPQEDETDLVVDEEVS